MAKLLLVGNTGEIAGANENDIIAVYEDDQLLGKKEQTFVESGRFKLVEVEKTVEQIRTEMNSAHPEINEYRFDSEPENRKDLNCRTRFSMNYADGSFVHNFKPDSGNDKEVNETKTAALEAEFAEPKSIEADNKKNG